MLKIIDKDIQILIEHLEGRGVVVDTLLNEHLLKVSDRLGELDKGEK